MARPIKEKPQRNWSSDCFYQRELERIWFAYGHDANVPESSFNWQSWNQKDEQSSMEEPKQ